MGSGAMWTLLTLHLVRIWFLLRDSQTTPGHMKPVPPHPLDPLSAPQLLPQPLLPQLPQFKWPQLPQLCPTWEPTQFPHQTIFQWLLMIMLLVHLTIPMMLLLVLLLLEMFLVVDMTQSQLETSDKETLQAELTFLLANKRTSNKKACKFQCTQLNIVFRSFS